MANLITGAVAIVLIVVFLGKYAVTLNSLPLWIIIVGTLVLVGYDYFSSLRARRERDDDPRS